MMRIMKLHTRKSIAMHIARVSHLRFVHMFLVGAFAASFAATAAEENVIVERNIVYGEGGGVDLKLDLIRPKEQNGQLLPAIVWIHGGGWKSGSKKSGLDTGIRYAQTGS